MRFFIFADDAILFHNQPAFKRIDQQFKNFGSPYLWNNTNIDSIIKELNKESDCKPCECTLIAGDLNLPKTYMNTMSSSDE